MKNPQPIPVSNAAQRNDLGQFSWSALIIGTFILLIFGLLYWLNLRESGLTSLFRRFQITLTPWSEYFAHLIVSLISGAIIISSNFIQAMAYYLSIFSGFESFLKRKISSKNLLKKNSMQLTISIIAFFLIVEAGGALLDIIEGINIPRTATIISLFLIVLGFFISQIQYYPYVKPVSLVIYNETNRHLVWETYQTPGKIRLGSDQYAYRALDDDRFELMRNDHDIDISAMTKLFFIQPDKINFKVSRQSLGVGNVRGNILFDMEIRMNEIYLPTKTTKTQLSILHKIFTSESKAVGFIKDNIAPEDLEATLTAAGKRINMINSYFISNKAALEEDASSILNKVTDLSGYREIVIKMRAQIRQKFDDILDKTSDEFIKFNFNITDDGTQEKQIIDKIELARSEAQKFMQRVIEQFVTAITTRIAQRGGNIDISLVGRINDILNNLMGKPTYSNLLESKLQIKALNEDAQKNGFKNLGNLEELKDEEAKVSD